MPTEYFYPAAGHLNGSIDGYVNRSATKRTWSDIHDGAGMNVGYAQSTANTKLRSYYLSGMWQSIQRLILTFPTNPIPADAIIDEALLRLYCEAVETEIPNCTNGIYESFPNSYQDLVAADYQHMYAVLLSDLITLTDVSPPCYVTHTFNPTGLTKIVKAGVTLLAIREGTYDAPDVEPAWAAYLDGGANFRMADYNPTTQKPRLEVTWHLPPTKGKAASRVITQTRLPTPSRVLTATRVLDP